MALGEQSFARKKPATGEQRRPVANERALAQAELKEAEAAALAANTWLRAIADKLARGNFSPEDSDHLRELLGSERFEEGSVQFLVSVVQALEQALTTEIEPERREAAEMRLAAAKKHLEALGKRLAGLRLLLNGPKSPQSTPPQA